MITPKKQLGQHWLNDHTTLKAIVDGANINAGETVLEIGPGLGSLTQELIDRGAKVTAIELDATLARQLTNRVKDKDHNLSIITGDIRRFNLNNLPKSYRVVANIPYYLTSGLIRYFGESDNPPAQVSILVQKEVAMRVCAHPGTLSILGVTTQMYFETTLGVVVPAELFTPPPKVDSQLLILHRRQEPYFKNQDSKQLFEIVKAGFSERRKKLRSSLSGGLRMPKDQIDELLNLADIDGNLRAQNLSLDDWLNLQRVYQGLLKT